MGKCLEAVLALIIAGAVPETEFSIRSAGKLYHLFVAILTARSKEKKKYTQKQSSNSLPNPLFIL